MAYNGECLVPSVSGLVLLRYRWPGDVCYAVLKRDLVLWHRHDLRANAAVGFFREPLLLVSPRG